MNGPCYMKREKYIQAIQNLSNDPDRDNRAELRTCGHGIDGVVCMHAYGLGSKEKGKS
jgi:hypothetical protein